MDIYRKKDLILDLANKQNISKKSAKETIDNILEILIKEMKIKDKVVISGFGIFENKFVEGYVQNNNMIGKLITIKERNRITFKMSKYLKKIVNDEV